jgi:hypothetical protein
MKRTLLAMMLIGTIALTFNQAFAQTNQKRAGWAARGHALAASDQQQMESLEASVLKEAEISKTALVGTWIINVPASPGGAEFNALQTFHAEGTMTETSDLLAKLGEGPAHGAWTGKKRDYQITFELFVFDPDGNSAGRVRVRASIRLTDEDNFTADSAVDFIEPDGNVIPDIGSGPFTGARLKVMAR